MQHQQALEAYTPPSVLIDETYEILHVSETAGRYRLRPRGPPTGDRLETWAPVLWEQGRAQRLTEPLNDGRGQAYAAWRVALVTAERKQVAQSGLAEEELCATMLASVAKSPAVPASIHQTIRSHSWLTPFF